MLDPIQPILSGGNLNRRHFLKLATLAGLAFYAASDPIDLRALSDAHQAVHRPKVRPSRSARSIR